MTLVLRGGMKLAVLLMWIHVMKIYPKVMK